VALILALSFGCYGLAKKKANAGAVESLVVETLVVSPVAVAYLVFLGATGASTFGSHGAGHVALVVGTGVVTVLPLLAFGGAATRIPLSTLGLMQYITPTVQFLLGILFFHEPMPAMRWVGFGLIWLALALFTAESLRYRQRQRRQLRARRSEVATPTG
jgi:chloramphenicol-sensitive protein RarD